MEFQTYARILLRRWWLILGLAAVAAAVAYGYAVRATPMYRATAQLSVTPSVIDYFTGEAVQRLLNNYSWRLRSPSFAAQVGAKLNPPDEGLAGKIKAVASPSEYRIAIEVDDARPARAQAIANAAATTFAELIRTENAGRERRDIEVQVLELAAEPGAPFQPRPRRDAFGAAILGALIGAGLAFLLEYLDDTFKSADEAGTSLQLPVLGTIPRTQRTRKGVLAHGLRPRRPSGRGDLHNAPLAGGGGVPDTAH
ncbi:MAG TPA: Wzz/FepE/Etk N-terminal domain-containing protein [Chloroflexota bacterium]|nr:Wzz/FepE/Etk N-terminal domain-containing protein [Chloroflexota bacterium]